ncbi:MAG: hypothetical protein HY930_07165 [Euryarchaeota archaeon]|nr:hypothetical protein [Euryarchaeota archaeon]
MRVVSYQKIGGNGVKNWKFLLAVLILPALLVLPVQAAEVVVSENYVIGFYPTKPVALPAPNATYVGSDACKTCHSKIYEDFKTSGHPYKIMTPSEARALRPNLPLPEGYAWDDITYVIGSWGWKARFMGKDGYIITKVGANRDKNGSNQYNLETGKWSDYSPGAKKVYDCTGCHNTGSKYGNKTQGNLPGIKGTWEFNGVECEACHGPGSEHVAKGGGKGVAINRDDSALLCGNCHRRGTDDTKIPASGGFIQHHEQYLEFLASPHKNLKCVACHDPHKGTFKGATNPKGAENGIKAGCETCHSGVKADFTGSKMQKVGVKCVDCHMPEATKSAVGDIKKFDGDVRTHLFKINKDAKATLTYKDEKGAEYASGYITLDFACLKCHGDKDKAWAAQYAAGVHKLGVVVETPKPTTPAPTTPAPTPAPKGICGPSAILAMAVLPVAIYGVVRRRK